MCSFASNAIGSHAAPLRATLLHFFSKNICRTLFFCTRSQKATFKGFPTKWYTLSLYESVVSIFRLLYTFRLICVCAALAPLRRRVSVLKIVFPKRRPVPVSLVRFLTPPNRPCQTSPCERRAWRWAETRWRRRCSSSSVGARRRRRRTRAASGDADRWACECARGVVGVCSAT